MSPLDTPQLVIDLYHLLCKHKAALQASELSDDETAYLKVVDKSLAELDGLELFWSPLFENEEREIVEPLNI